VFQTFAVSSLAAALDIETTARWPEATGQSCRANGSSAPHRLATRRYLVGRDHGRAMTFEDKPGGRAAPGPT
jgi:hypothetical protein